MNIVIRTDASTRIGLGHIARCRTLAAALQEQGATLHFICRAHPGHQIDALRGEGYHVTALPAPPSQASDDADYTGWLGVSQPHDAEETITALTRDNRTAPDWLIVDNYALDAAWQQLLRPFVGNIMVIDDLANRLHDCDLLLDQNFSLSSQARYVNLLPPRAQRLLGPHYALLRPEYAEMRQGLSRCFIPVAGEGQPPSQCGPAPVHRILVFFGGTDADNLSARALQALSHSSMTMLHVDIVVGANNPHREQLVAQAMARGNTEIHAPRPHLADLMANADLAIGAGGATTWERCCLGLPSIVVSVAENQRPACEALAAANLIDYRGHEGQITAATLRPAIQALLDDQQRRQRLAENGLRLVDGQGTQRLIRAMQSADETKTYAS
jgi:UDP-2,4-diacetamido-2,4,6-trideoxy-beta-L-altropyranose hydrolase